MKLTAHIDHGFAGFTLNAGFEAPRGVTALFGRSGAGKTTLANAVAGLLRPDKAEIMLGDTVLTDTSRRIFLPPAARRIGYVFQDARLFPHMTVRRNLDYGRRFAPRPERPDAQRVAEIVELLGIGPLLDRRPGALSGGERQRVALGRAILSGPRMLLMDEPLAALDEARKGEILPYLEKLRDLGMPILYVSHNLAEIVRLADQVVMLEAGRVVASGPVQDVLSDPASDIALGRETGALIPATVAAQDTDGLARLDCAAGPVWVARPDLSVGAHVRVRVLAQEVMLATEKPQQISALNVLPGVVETLEQDVTGSVLVRLRLGEDAAILSRITQRSLRALDLSPGKRVYAILKTVSIAEVARG
ncbi:molybdenum ABC transporter ATP-binding protein [Paracoccus sp. SCSIO 75233]|uniref:molybdenum ABC transporter ATP-binding protein n=1 Tax=Paracoccus sp. SCSIO 75233 TaxID=3017782 RepID=UPI0022F02B3C|nr:molybdenum ABC transporter ATP-binding protein [Paracoccus sp. SCSIO 75233]WBU54262.1 molybdenum ABC transporter ATP-binding protein [Paracoccus sp. SCSIO 75233]